MKRYSKSQLAKAYLALAQETSPAHAVRALAAALITSRRSHEGDTLVREIHRQLLQTKGIAHAEVVSVSTLSSNLKQEIEKVIKHVSDAKRISAHYTQDKSLLGGFIAKLPNHEIDASLASRIYHLHV